MRLISWALGLAFFSAVFAQADADVEDGIVVSDGPEVTVTASFPEDNPFGRKSIIAPTIDKAHSLQRSLTASATV